MAVAPRIVAPPPVRDLHFVSTGTGRGVLVWLDASCSTTELSGGAVHAATVEDGAAGTPAVVDAAGFAVGLAAGPGGTAEGSWIGSSPSDPNGGMKVARTDASGVFGTPFVPADNLVAVSADARGNQLVGVADPRWLSVGGLPTDLRVRTPDGALTPPPLPTGRAGSPGAVMPVGSGLAVAVVTRGGLRFASWTP